MCGYAILPSTHTHGYAMQALRPSLLHVCVMRSVLIPDYVRLWGDGRTNTHTHGYAIYDYVILALMHDYVMPGVLLPDYVRRL